MKIEKELKYLVPLELFKKLKVESQAVDVQEINQVYLSTLDNSKFAHRVRRIRNLDGNNQRYYHTFKIPLKEGAEEYEYLIEAELGEFILNCYPNLVKTRYVYLDEHYNSWEFDVFGGTHSGLIIAELEYDSKDFLELPDWVGNLKEVTKDSSYSNYKLFTTIW